MKSAFQKTILASLVLMALSACQPKEKVTQNDVSVVTTKSTMDSETLALAGEQLVGPYTFMLADKAFDMALEKDPANQRALFLKSFIKRYMALRGVVNRVRPFFAKAGQQDSNDKWIATLPNSPLRTFLMDGPQDVSDEEGIQKILDAYVSGVDEFRRFVKKNPDMNITLNLNPHIFKDRIAENQANSCQSQNNSDGGFTVNCDFSGVAQVKINSADLVILGQEAAGEILYLSTLTTYGMNGLSKWARYVDSHPGVHPPKESNAFLAAIPEFGHIRKTQTLTMIPELGADLSAALKWVIQYQQELCPTGHADAHNRVGFLTNQGLCVDLETAPRSVAFLDSVLSGVITTSAKKPTGEDMQIRVDYLAWARKPVQDLRVLLPATYDTCGNATSYKDGTFGGMLPDGNFNQLIGPTPDCVGNVSR